MNNIIWFTGLSSSGKTTLAYELMKLIDSPIVLLDGDIVRKTLSKDLGYKKEERDKHITRVADVCQLITDNDVLNIACVVSPTKKIRNYARNSIQNFVEVYIKCPVEVCEKRDVKGYYKKVRDGELKNFVGIDIKYEEPKSPELVLETSKETIQQSVDKLFKYLKCKNII